MEAALGATATFTRVVPMPGASTPSSSAPIRTRARPQRERRISTAPLTASAATASTV
jgi:hypothetical protein